MDVGGSGCGRVIRGGRTCLTGIISPILVCSEHTLRTGSLIVGCNVGCPIANKTLTFKFGGVWVWIDLNRIDRA